MPAWVHEPTRSGEYADYAGEVEHPREMRDRGPSP